MQKFLATAATMVLLSALQASAGEMVGTAIESLNDVTGTLDALTRAIGRGDGVSANEIVKTGAESTTHIAFLDDTMLTVGASSTIVLDRFVYNPQGSADDAVLNLTKGAFRFVTGKSDPSKFEIRTQVATLGIRGTDFVVICDGKTRCAVIVAKGLVKICPRPDQPIDCGTAFSLDKVKNAAIIEANGRTTGAESISPRLVASIMERVANGKALSPTVVSVGFAPPPRQPTPKPVNASPG